MNNFFDKIFCLNLESRQDRWEKSCQEFLKHNIHAERIYGIDGRKCNTTNLKISKGAFGCLLSQFFVLKYAQHLGLKNFLFLEDDIEFDEDAINIFNTIKNQIPPDWDMLYLGGNHYIGQNLKKINKHIYQCESTLSAHAVGFNSKVFEKILYQITNTNYAVDEHYASLHKDIKAYVIIPHIAWQKAGYSNIEEEYIDYAFLKNHTYEEFN
jgi:GR25 family glycosyltransferase involved in LPS biosynthesis